jgi:hypothetical protein
MADERVNPLIAASAVSKFDRNSVNYRNRTKFTAQVESNALISLVNLKNSNELNEWPVSSMTPWPCTWRRYEFMSEEGDIGFRVYYLEEDKKVDVVPSQRIDSHLMMESGAISCWRSNTCQFVSQFFSLLTRQQCPLRCRCRRI